MVTLANVVLKCFASVLFMQVKEQKEEAERFQQKLKEMEDLKIESFLVQLFHINKVLTAVAQNPTARTKFVGRKTTDRRVLNTGK